MSNAASMRQALLKVHRYVGLALAPFIISNEAFADPYTGERLGERFIGDFSLQPKDLSSQIYYLHHALVLRASSTITSWIIALHVTAIRGRNPQSRVRDVRDDFHSRPSVRVPAR